MEKNIVKKIIGIAYKILIIAGIFFLCANFFLKKVNAEKTDFDAQQKKIILNDNGNVFEVFSNSKTVEDFLQGQKIQLNPNDVVIPEKDAKIFSGTKVMILRAKKIIVKEGGKTNTFYTFQSTIEKALWENKNIELDEDDVTVPARSLPVADGMNIAVTHVMIKEETKNIDIDYKTVSNEDDSLGWRVKKVSQPGQKGIKEVKYKVVYNDGKEISRKVLESNVTKDPVDEIVTQGTLVKVGKTYNGVGSWYAYTGTLSAANPWLPMGSYARVTNKDNGKSVIVKINDRGPFGNGRIIDLDKVAFSQIANLGQGTANFKVEAITN